MLKYKYDENGKINRYKAHRVARGDKQCEGIDYTEIFAPTFRLESLRMIIAYAAALDLLMHQFDIVTAYLNAPIDKHILMNLPDGASISF